LVSQVACNAFTAVFIEENQVFAASGYFTVAVELNSIRATLSSAGFNAFTNISIAVFASISLQIQSAQEKF
jgi:hypothetical protein